MTSNGLRTQYPYVGEALSPRPLYDFPSPTSNYPSSINGGASPGFIPMAYLNSPRYISSAFIPPPDVFLEGSKGSVLANGAYTPRDSRKQGSDMLNSDPVAMHLLVETAIGDSQSFEIMSVEEVEALKQEQKVLDARLGIVRKKLESETKIRDAAKSITRLNSKKEQGHQRGLSSRDHSAVKDTATKTEEELSTSNKKVDDLARELFEIEARMRMNDTQLLMHTAAVLQITHNGPKKRNQNPQTPNGVDQRPDSPASIYTYETVRITQSQGENNFDERSLYRSPENLDGLMNALHNGSHHQREESVREVDPQQSQTLSVMEKRVEELNERLRELIIQANPGRNQEYFLPPQTDGTTNASSVERQLDFLDQGLRDIGAEQDELRNNSIQTLDAVEGRLEGINNQLYAMLSRADTSDSEGVQPPPSLPGGGSQEQLNYMEDSFYNMEQIQYSLNQQIDELRSKPPEPANPQGEDVEKYEAALMSLWSIILAGEEEARQRKRQRRELLASDPDADEELSPDEDYNASEQFSLVAFSTKVQWLLNRATTLKDKQSILLRQIKQQRELNSKSDAQKEEKFNQLNERVLSARSDKKTMEDELERAMSQLKQFDEQKNENENEAQALQDAQERCMFLEAQLRDAQDDAHVEAATIQAELSQSSAKINEVMAALQAATSEKESLQEKIEEATDTLNAKEEELRDLEGEVVRLTTELTFAKAELDGAYGTRAERAAESAANPYIKRELDELVTKNAALLNEIESLRKAQDAASQSEAESRESERTLKAELTGMAAEYEALTRDAIQNEKDRDSLEASIDKLRDEKEALEMELSDERVKVLGVRSPSLPNGAPVDLGATSIRMLREEFRKMMRDKTAEGLRALRHEQEERRKLEATVRSLRKDAAPQKSNLSKIMTA